MGLAVLAMAFVCLGAPSGPEKTAREYIRAIGEGDCDRAESLFSPEVRSILASPNCERHYVIRNDILTRDSDWLSGGKEVVVLLKGSKLDGMHWEGTLVFTMEKLNGRWYIYHIRDFMSYH